MSAHIEIDEELHEALPKMARRRRMPVRRLLERAVDEFMERSQDEDLLLSSAEVARRSGLRERDAVKLVKGWRAKSQR